MELRRRLVVIMLTLLSLSGSSAVTTAGAQEFLVINALAHTAAGDQFERDVGAQHVEEVLADASFLVWRTLGQETAADRKHFATVTLVVEGVPGRRSSVTNGSVIRLGNGDATEQYNGPDTAERFDKETVDAVVYHEAANVWQFDGEGGASAGLLAGIADLVQMRAGYAPPAGWARAGEGERWDERSPGVTARFLDYCDAEVKPAGFMAELGRMLKNRRYTDHFFVEITGKTVDNLWKQYKAKYNNA